MIGSAVIEPPPSVSDSFAALSRSLEWRKKTSHGYASLPGGLLRRSDISLYATACFERSSYTISACFPFSMKNSANAQPAYGARYCIDAGSEAPAETTIV